jgi:NADPH:quinone reductase-like Zn-dependent oxidoreductase
MSVAERAERIEGTNPPDTGGPWGGAEGTRTPLPAQTPPANPAGPWTVGTLGFAAPRRTALFTYEEGELPEGQFRIRTLYTGLSAGTELTHFKGTNQYLHKRWDDKLKLFRPAPAGAASEASPAGGASQQYPLWVSGYMEVGEVCASRSRTVHEGQIVAAAYGHKTGHTADPLNDFYVPLSAPSAPPTSNGEQAAAETKAASGASGAGSIDPVLGIYVAQMGPICANAILHADAEAFGAAAGRFGCGVDDQRVMVFGSGVIGLFTAMLARWCGAREVVVADTGEQRLAAARALAFAAVDTEADDPATWAKERWGTGPDGDRGADLVFQCRARDAALAQALDCLRPQGTVIDLAFYQNGAAAVQLGEAFHHNGLRHVAAQIFRVPRRLQHAWDRRRLSDVTVRFLAAHGDDVKRHLITEVVPLDQAQRVFEDIAAKRRQPLQVVFSVPDTAATPIAPDGMAAS